MSKKDGVIAQQKNGFIVSFTSLYPKTDPATGKNNTSINQDRGFIIDIDDAAVVAKCSGLDDKQITTRLQVALRRLNKEMAQNFPVEVMHSGCTASGSIQIPTADGQSVQIYTFNLGDSFTQLVQRTGSGHGAKVTLSHRTKDHTPEVASEAERISQKGGEIQDGRLCNGGAGIAVSRALGDIIHVPSGLSSLADCRLIATIPFTQVADHCLLSCSDGVNKWARGDLAQETQFLQQQLTQVFLSEDAKQQGQGLAQACHEVRKKDVEARITSDDTTMVLTALIAVAKSITLSGTCDGHGLYGHVIAEYVIKNLARILTVALTSDEQLSVTAGSSASAALAPDHKLTQMAVEPWVVASTQPKQERKSVRKATLSAEPDVRSDAPPASAGHSPSGSSSSAAAALPPAEAPPPSPTKVTLVAEGGAGEIVGMSSGLAGVFSTQPSGKDRDLLIDTTTRLLPTASALLSLASAFVEVDHDGLWHNLQEIINDYVFDVATLENNFIPINTLACIIPFTAANKARYLFVQNSSNQMILLATQQQSGYQFTTLTPARVTKGGTSLPTFNATPPILYHLPDDEAVVSHVLVVPHSRWSSFAGIQKKRAMHRALEERGNPVFFDECFFPELSQLEMKSQTIAKTPAAAGKAASAHLSPLQAFLREVVKGEVSSAPAPEVSSASAITESLFSALFGPALAPAPTEPAYLPTSGVVSCLPVVSTAELKTLQKAGILERKMQVGHSSRAGSAAQQQPTSMQQILQDLGDVSVLSPAKLSEHVRDLEFYSHAGSALQRSQATLLLGNFYLYLVMKSSSEGVNVAELNVMHCCKLYEKVLYIAAQCIVDSRDLGFTVFAGLNILKDNLELVVSNKMGSEFKESNPTWLRFLSLTTTVDQLIAICPTLEAGIEADKADIPIVKLTNLHFRPGASISVSSLGVDPGSIVEQKEGGLIVSIPSSKLKTNPKTSKNDSINQDRGFILDIKDSGVLAQCVKLDDKDVMTVLQATLRRLRHEIVTQFGAVEAVMSGCTASGSLQIPSADGQFVRIFTFNMGDSFTQLHAQSSKGMQGGLSKRTADHTPAEEGEAKRITAKGGRILNQGGEMRIAVPKEGGENLSVSRALGDIALVRYGVSAVADCVLIATLPVADAKNHHLLSCSDGTNQWAKKKSEDAKAQSPESESETYIFAQQLAAMPFAADPAQQGAKLLTICSNLQKRDRGKRGDYLDDSTMIWIDIIADGKRIRMGGVCDGHGLYGHVIAQYVADNAARCFTESLEYSQQLQQVVAPPQPDIGPVYVATQSWVMATTQASPERKSPLKPAPSASAEQGGSAGGRSRDSGASSARSGSHHSTASSASTASVQTLGEGSGQVICMPSGLAGVFSIDKAGPFKRRKEKSEASTVDKATRLLPTASAFLSLISSFIETDLDGLEYPMKVMVSDYLLSFVDTVFSKIALDTLVYIIPFTDANGARCLYVLNRSDHMIVLAKKTQEEYKFATIAPARILEKVGQALPLDVAATSIIYRLPPVEEATTQHILVIPRSLFADAELQKKQVQQCTAEFILYDMVSFDEYSFSSEAKERAEAASQPGRVYLQAVVDGQEPPKRVTLPPSIPAAEGRVSAAGSAEAPSLATAHPTVLASPPSSRSSAGLVSRMQILSPAELKTSRETGVTKGKMLVIGKDPLPADAQRVTGEVKAASISKILAELKDVFAWPESKMHQCLTAHGYSIERYINIGNALQRCQAALLRGNILIYHIAKSQVGGLVEALNCCEIYEKVFCIAATSFSNDDSDKFAVLAGLRTLGDNLKLVVTQIKDRSLSESTSWKQFQALEKLVSELHCLPTVKAKLDAPHEIVSIAKLTAAHMTPAASASSDPLAKAGKTLVGGR